MRNLLLGLMAVGLAIGNVACQPGGEQLKQIAEQQEELLKEIKAVKADVKRLAARPTAAAAPKRPQEDPNKVYKINLGDSPFLGKADAKVAIVEWSDFQCPYCARATPLLTEVQKKYPNDVKIIFKHFPLSFHQAARPAAIASVAAQEQGKFWEMHDALFENQRSLTAGNMEEIAEKAGLDMDRFRKDMEANKSAYDKRVTADFTHGQSVTVRGTPKAVGLPNRGRRWRAGSGRPVSPRPGFRSLR